MACSTCSMAVVQSYNLLYCLQEGFLKITAGEGYIQPDRENEERMREQTQNQLLVYSIRPWGNVFRGADCLSFSWRHWKWRGTKYLAAMIHTQQIAWVQNTAGFYYHSAFVYIHSDLLLGNTFRVQPSQTVYYVCFSGHLWYFVSFICQGGSAGCMSSKHVQGFCFHP